MANLLSTNVTITSERDLKGAQNRLNPKSKAIRVLEDAYTVVAASWLVTNVLQIGPIPAGVKINTAKVIGDGTVDLGDDVDVGWAYADATSSDDDAFATGTDMSATLIDGLGLEFCANVEPPTNDR